MWGEGAVSHFFSEGGGESKTYCLSTVTPMNPA